MTISVFSFMTNFYGKYGDALIGRDALTNLANFVLGSQNGITALAGGAQAGSPVLAYADNEIDTVVTTNDSVQLPIAIPGAMLSVYNAGANTARIYAGAAPNINNLVAGVAQLDQIVANATISKTANAAAITLASGYTLTFNCYTIGLWKQLAVAS
jgi:hypothetical protein